MYSGLVPHDCALLITGSLNAMEEDREHDARSNIHPLQIVMDGTVSKCPYFSDWGELGISSLVYRASAGLVMYITTGSDLIELHIEKRRVVSAEHFEIPNLKDVHEIALFDDVLWLANTGFDDAIAFDLERKEVVRRVRMDDFRQRSRIERWLLTGDEQQLEVDRYHCNQIFKGLDGKLYALVHHVNGKQLLRRIANKLTKVHGNGGIINIDTGQKIQLGLKGPHSVRCIQDEYWICDSGSRSVNIYSQNWELKTRLPTVGWARGADVRLKDNLYYVGVSAQRQRYRDRPDFNDKNLVHVFRVSDRAALGDILIREGIEQINNVYLVPKDMAETLLRLQ